MAAHIYKVTNLIDGKVYIGQHNGTVKNYFAGGTYIKRSIKKHGKENFKREIIIEGDFTIEELNKLEIKSIYECQSYHHDYPDKGYNLTIGGEGVSRRVVSKETKDKQSNSMKKVWSDNAYRKRLSNIQKGQKSWNKGKKIYNESFTQKMSGENNPMYGITPTNAKIVLDLKTGIYYNSIKEACFVANYSRDCLSKMLRGKIRNKTSFIQI